MTFIDPSHPASIEYIKNEIRTVRNFGIKMIKFDFLCHDIFGHYGFDMGTELFEKNIPFYNKEKTTAQIIKEFYFALREAAGEDCIIIGCNAVSHMAAGIVDIQRTGDDTSGREWERTLKMGVNTLAWRMHQHKTFYAHDADCVGITKDIPWEKNSMWLRLLAESGTPLFVSVDEDCRTFNVQKALSEAFDTACIKFLEDSYLIPCTNELTPQKWQREEKTFEYKWN
jgi:alpha-galactosidase